eukprot:TRINITY_DN645_c0_g1_i3.p1 TRINITY_DN645_c0_g1~~TRINITY_DN645_c0_g1_i3.p1  ORF type:complete len:2362 (+),score=686.01 TRINITY_DN645_c0_g1_i3:233-7087(+)
MNKKVIRLGAEDDECAKQYNFDGTFNPDCTQEEVFQVIAKPSIEHVLKGYTAAIMAYGQTGTGKSFTMSNMKPGQEGVIPRSAGYLFDLIEKDTSSKYTLSAHFVQIYRDTLSDLMVEEGTSSKTDIHYTPQTGVEITNAVKTPINSKQDFLDMYQTGDVRRVVRATKMNPESSRGHTALVLYVSVEPTDPDNMNCATKGKITFIDLAGYERFEKTGLKDPIHKDEAKKINASLLSLGTVVTALSENMSHVPWRNSKLTRLLQDSIGGKSRSTIMITVGPSSSHNHETTNSLDFGNRAMAVKVSAKLEQITDFKKLAAKLQELLDEKEEKISKLEVAAKVREAERAERDRRQKMDLARLRARHQEELTNLMNNGATPEAIQALLKQHEIEDENMEEMQVEERELDEERHEEEERELVAEIEAEHRVRAQSMKREGGESKQKELDAAYALIAQLRGSEGSDTNTIAKEIAELAGVDPDDAAAAASPKTVTSAEVAILRREADQLRLECETEKQNAEEKVEKAKNALKKCAGLLKEEREKNKRLSEESVKAEELEKLQGEIEEIKNAKQLATEHRDELQEKLEKSRNSQSKLMSDKKEVMKQKEELEANYKKQAEDSSEKQADYDKKLAELNAQIAKLEEEIKTLSEQLQEATAATEGLQKTISEKEDQLTKSVAELEEALSKLANNETSLTEEQESRRKRERELEKAVEQCRDETRDVEKSLQQEIEEIQISCSSETQTLKDKIAELQQSLDEMGNEREKFLAEIEEHKTLQSSTSAELTAVTEARDAATKQAEETNAKLETLQIENEESKEEKNKQIESLEAKVTSGLETAASLTKLLEEKTAEAAKEKEELQEKVATLEKGLKDGGNENSTLLSKNSDMEKEVSELQAQTARDKETIATLEKASEEDKTSAAEAEARLTDKINTLETSLAESTARAGSESAASAEQITLLSTQLSEQQSESDKQAAAHAEEIKSFESKVADLDATISDLTAQNAELQKKFDDSTASAGDQQQTLQANITSLEEKLSELQSSTDEERNKLNSQIEDLSKQLTDSTTAAAEQKENLETQQSEEREAFNTRKEELEGKLKELQEQLELSKTEAAEQKAAAGSESDTLQSKVKELETALEAATAAAAEQTSEYESSKNSLDARVKELEDSITAATATAADQQAAAETEKESLNTKIAEMESQLEALDSDATQQKESFDKQAADTSAAHQQEKADLETKIASLQDEITTLQSNSEQQKEHLEKQAAENETAHAKDKELLEAKISDLEKQLVETTESASHQKEELEQQIAAGNTEREGLQSQLADVQNQLEVSNGDASQRQTALEQELDQLNSKINDLEGQLEEIRNSAAQEKSSLEQQLADTASAADSDKADLRKQLDDAISQLEGEKQAIADSNAELEQKLAALQAESASAQQELQSNNEALEATVADLQKQLSDAIAKAEADIATMTAKEEELHGQMEEQQTEFQTEKAILEEELEAANEEKEEALAEVERTKAESEEEIEKLTVAHAEEIEKNETAANEYAALLEARVAELEDKLKELQGDLSDEKTKAELELMELKKKKDEERETERQRLNDEKDRLNDEKAELEAKVKSRGKYKYKSSLISQLITCGQLAVPSSAPRLAPPHDILASLNPEHVKQACRYRLIITGHQHTGKSSVYKCLSHEGSVSILGKKAPDVVSPTTTMQCTEHTVREKGKGFLSKKSSLTTHFQVWDTPSDLKVMAALPEGVLPITGCAYVLTYYLTREFKSESQRMDEVLYSILTNTRAKLDKVKMKLPILLVGTRKDMLPSRDSNVLLGKINEARRWFNDNPIAQNYFSLVGVYASSCKDWSVYSDTGKNGISTFGGIMSYVAEEVRRLYPNTPPAMLGEKTNDADADLGDWLAGNKSVSSDSQRMAQAVHKALLSSIMSFDIMKRRGAWLLGNQEFRGILQDNIPDHVLETFPDLADTFISVFEARGYILHIKDSAFDDERESCFVIKVGVLIDFITSLMLPTLYLQLVPSYANDKPGYLKTSMLKSSGFNIEEVWRPDWELIFDGHMTGTSTSSLLKNSLAFQNDPMLGSSLLECLHCGFRMKTSKDERITFVTGIAIRSLVPELEGVFLALFDKHSTGWTAATAKIDSISQQDVVKVQQKIFSEQEDCLLWNDAVAFNRGDTWTFIRMRKNEIVVCTGKSDMNMFADMKKTVETIFGISQFRDGMKLDHLPSLTPALQDAIKESTSISEYLNSLSKDQIRGISFPSDSLDRDSGRRRPPVSIHRDSNGSSPASGKISADRMAMFQ